MFVSLFIAAAVAGGSDGTTGNPLANAEKGQLQCYRPDVGRKTCQSIAAYDRKGPGTYDNKATIPLGNGAMLETHAPVEVRGDAVCGFIRSADVIAGQIKLAGEVLPPERAKPALERIAQAMAPLTDKEICTRYEQSRGHLIAKISISGAYQPDKDEAVKWIDPTDGYIVTP